jgi:hypothetical protein
MKSAFNMTFVGLSERKSKDGQKVYRTANFNDDEADTIYSFYIPEEKQAQFEGLKKYTPVVVGVALSTYNGQVQVNFDSVSPIKKG